MSAHRWPYWPCFNNSFIFSLLSLLPPRPSFGRPALSESFRIRKSPFSIDFDESITDRLTDGQTNGPTDRRTRPLIEMRMHLETGKDGPTDRPTIGHSYTEAIEIQGEKPRKPEHPHLQP